MHCHTCNYPLWNLTTRQCPECGAPFAVDDYEFVPGSVRFCCPDCRQAYYGTTAKGHLEPRAFQCVTCGRQIDMNDTVLVPAEGVDERNTRADANPWLERSQLGAIKGWLQAIGMALVKPLRLMRGTPASSSMGQAWWFTVVTLVAGLLLAFIPTVAFVLILPMMASAASQGGGGPGALPLMAGAGAAMAIGFAIAVVMLMIYALLWGLVTHAMLRISGRGHGTLRRTYQAICYAAGANITLAIPCFGQYVAMPWWIVSAVLMVKEGHNVHGGRATLAVVTFPVCLLVLLVGLYAVMIVAVFANASVAMQQGAVTNAETQIVVDALLAYAGDHQGRGPAHGALLMTAGDLEAWEIVGGGTLTATGDIPVGDKSMEDFMVLPADLQQGLADAASASLPAGTIAHRVGDFVFTYHGIDLTAPDPGLWLVIASPDPDVNAVPPRMVVVGLADGTVQSIPAGNFAFRQSAQNALRARRGLPPLPAPGQVTHDAPATGGPDSK